MSDPSEHQATIRTDAAVCRPASLLAWCLLAGGLGLVWTPPALAAPPAAHPQHGVASPPDRRHAAAEALAVQATNAYTAGDFAKAAKLYLTAFKTDDRQAEFLFAAARAEQLDDRGDEAAEHFEQFLQRPDAAPGRLDKAKSYLLEIKGQQSTDRAREKVRLAEAEARKGAHSVAAQLYADAVGLAPHKVEWLLRAASEFAAAGDTTHAMERLHAYLQTAPPQAPDREEARARLEALTAARAQPGVAAPAEPVRTSAVTAPPAPPPVQPAQTPLTMPPPLSTHVAAPAPEDNRLLVWTLVGAGAGLVGVGMGLWLSTLGDASALQSDLAHTDASGQIVGTNLETARNAASSINLRTGLGIGLAGVGVVSAGVGSWLMWRAPGAVTVAPVPNGLLMQARF